MYLLRKFISSCVIFENQVTRCAHNSRSYNSLIEHKDFDVSMLNKTKKQHAFLLKSNVMSCNIYAANNIVRRYWECSRMDYSFKLFDEIPETNLVTWNLMISGCSKNFLFEDSWRVFCRVHDLGIGADEFTYGSVIAACVASENSVRGEKIYGVLVKNGFFAYGYVRAGMIDLFTRCSRVEDALKVLYDVPCENVVCWNSLVSGAVKSGDNWVAWVVFKQMCCNETLFPNAYTFSSVLTACAELKELDFGKTVHGRVIKWGTETDIFVGTSLLDLYAKHGAIRDASKQFRLMPERNVVSWTAMISGFVQQGDSASAIMILNDLKKAGEEINSFTISSVLAACGSSDMFGEASQIHSWVVKVGLSLDPIVKSSLVSTYSKLGAITLAEILFAETENANDENGWANMICALAQNGCYEKAISLFRRMPKQGFIPNQFSVSSILSIIEHLTLGRQVHGYIIKVGLISNVSVGSSILTMYSKCGSLDELVNTFEQIEKKDNVVWTSMIAGFTEHGYADKGIQLFRDVVSDNPINDAVILTTVLNACSATCSLRSGREIHGFALRRHFCKQTTIDGALVNMYSKCDDLNSARFVFHAMPTKDHVSWSSIVSGFAQKGRIEEALELFHDMLLSHVSTDAYTISSVLGGLTVSGNLGIGTQLHGHVVKVGLESESSVGSSLVMMYSKHGNIDGCDKAFREIRNPDLVSWTTIMASYAHHGKGSEALELYNAMKNAGIKPDSVTFLGVLLACSHSGLVEEGYFHLNSMIDDYGIEPGYKHYNCMVDLLGRAGRLKEAERFIRDMPLKPNSLVWETLLASCKIHGDHELAKLASEKIMESQPCDGGAYVSLSNIYANAGDWDRVVQIRDSMREVGTRQKEPGWSSI